MAALLPCRAITGTVLLACLAGGMAAAPTQAAAPLNDCVRTDNGDPDVTSLDITPRRVDVTDGPQVVTVSLTAADTGGPGPPTGIRQLSGTLGKGRSVLFRPVSGDRWQGRVTLLPGTGLAGRLRLLVSFRDGSGGAGSYLTADDLVAAGFDPYLRVRDHNPVDTQRPVLAALLLSRARVDTRDGPREVEVRARLRDNLSGVGRVTVETDAARTRLHLVSGTRRNGMWKGRLTMGQWVGTHTAPLSVKLFDRAGTRRIYGRTALRDNGFPDRLDIVARHDVTAPLPTLESELPEALDVRTTDASFPVRLHVVDAGSGAATVSVHLETPHGTNRAPSTRLRLTDGTPADGHWEGSVRMSHCSAVSASYQLFVRVRDVRGGSATPTFEDDSVAVTAGDHSVLPAFGRVLTWQSPAALHVRFDEDVVGISPTSAVVRRTEYRPSVTTTVVSGSWSCSDSAGQVTSCAAGPVRTATATLSDPPTKDADYQVLLNPEHVLDITDLAGNPFRRFEVYLGRCCTP